MIPDIAGGLGLNGPDHVGVLPVDQHFVELHVITSVQLSLHKNFLDRLADVPSYEKDVLLSIKRRFHVAVSP